MARKPVRCWLSHSWSPPSVEKLCLPSSTTALEVPLAAIGFFHEAAGLTRPAGIWAMAPVKAARRRGSGTNQQRPLVLVELGVMCTRLVVPACQLGARWSARPPHWVFSVSRTGKLLGLDVVPDVQLLQDGNMADFLASHNDQDRRGTAVVITTCRGPHCPVELS